MDHFHQKWDVDPADPGSALVLGWASKHRSKARQHWHQWLRFLGSKRAPKVIASVDAFLNSRRYRLAHCEPGRALDGGRGRAGLPSAAAATITCQQAA
jgi:hypothetical protein